MNNLACFDLDGTFLREPSLFARSLHARPTADTCRPKGYLGNGTVDYVSQEVLEELAEQYGQTSSQYVQQGIRMLLRDNAHRRSPAELLEISQTGGFWPTSQHFRPAIAAFAVALQQTGNHLHCETYSPQFLTEHLLCVEGFTSQTAHVTFNTVTGSTYETCKNGKLSGTAYTQGDKANSLKKRFGAHVRPEFAFGDTETDLSMLALARFAVVVNPNPIMREYALTESLTLVDEDDTGVTITKNNHATTIALQELADLPAKTLLKLITV